MRRRRAAPAFVAGALFLSPALAQERATPDGDPEAGRKIAAGICQSCHGMNGIPQQPEMPTIAGSDATYLVRQLEAYRTGDRKNDMMSAVAPMLDEQKTADVAAYYAGMRVTAEPP